MEKLKQGDKIVYIGSENEYVKRRLNGKYKLLEKGKVYTIESIVHYAKLYYVMTLEEVEKRTFDPIYFEELKEHRKRKLKTIHNPSDEQKYS